MKKVIRVSLSFVRERPNRVMLTSLATIAATCIVVWVASGYDMLLKNFDIYSDLVLGRYELAVAPIDLNGETVVPAEVLSDLRNDSSVAAADPFWGEMLKVRPLHAQKNEEADSPSDQDSRRRPISMILATDSREPPFDMHAGRWLDPSGQGSHEIVVRADVAHTWGLETGDSVSIGDGDQTEPFQVIGIVDAPTIMGPGGEAAIQIITPGSGEFFVSTAAAEKLFAKQAEISMIGVALQPDADLTRFRFGWGPRLSRYSTPVQFQESIDIEEALDESASAQNVLIQSYAATGIAILIAMLVIFSTLSMGITERVRQYAILRAIGFTRFEVGTLIACEGLLLAAIGFVGGILLGQLLLWMSVRASGGLLHHGTSVGPFSLLLAGVATFGGAFLAALIPIWQVTRAKPIAAMAPRPQLAGLQAVPWKTVGLGLILICINPLLIFLFLPDHTYGVTATLIIGFGSLAVGFVLLSPGIVILVDRWGSPVLARLFGLDPKLLRSQITNHLWRTVGAAISIAIGTGLYIGILVWGFTMLEAFIPGPWAPDALIAFREVEIPPEEAAALAAVPGIDPERCEPIVVEQPRLLNDLTNSAERASVTRQDNVVIIGIDPEGAFLGEHPLFDLEWVAGSPESAVSLLQQGNACVVPDHFLKETGLVTGDQFTLVPPENPDQPVKYTIAGAVRLPGWHWQTKLTGFRSRTHRAAALVFASYESVAQDFNKPVASYVWFDYASNQSNPDQILQAAQKHLQVPAIAANDDPLASSEGAPGLRMMPVENIRAITRGAASRWIWMLSQIPLITILIAGFGVLNVIIASVRSRRWEMGVLRSLGITSWSLVLVVLAEGLLIGIVAGLISFGFGMMAGWCGAGIAQYFSFFGGLHPDLSVPWFAILSGLAGMLVFSVLIAVWPAVSVGKKRPLTLLQQGRGTI
ncbi:ABC transporter permease [Gimesia maris]|uniref:ABC transporter permease n=1 Tax=Gimesia maris TaxID=122 RepID=UPI00241F4CF2|nr:ABC transporter permease [Gimesia maris]